VVFLSRDCEGAVAKVLAKLLSTATLSCTLLLCAVGLPPLPRVDASHYLPVVRTQIEQAEARALAHPRDANAAGALAMTLHAYQQYDFASAAYSRAHLLDPQNFDWLYLLGSAQMETGNFAAAITTFQSGLRLRPEDLPAQLRLAKSLTALARWDEAGALYWQILIHYPDCPQAWYGSGRVHAVKNDHAGAAECFMKACDLFPTYGAAHFALAVELRRLGKNSEAEVQLAFYSKYVTDEPPLADPLFERVHDLNHSVSIHIERAAAFEKAGKLDRAILEHEEALAVDPTDVQVHVNLVSLYGRAGDAAKAKQHFDEVMKLNPGRSDAWYDYGVLLFREREYAEAESALRHALEINPHYAEAHNTLGAIYEQQGQLDDAAKQFRQAITDRPDYSPARFHLGRLLVNENKYDDAIHEFLRILTPEDENTTTYLYALAATYARSGDREQARRYFQKARDSAVGHSQKQMLDAIERDLATITGQNSEPQR